MIHSDEQSRANHEPTFESSLIDQQNDDRIYVYAEEDIYLPSQREIDERLAEIRAGWSPQMERRRVVGGASAKAASDWSPPVIANSSVSSKIRPASSEYDG